MVFNGPNWSKMVPVGLKWSEMVPNTLTWSKIRTKVLLIDVDDEVALQVSPAGRATPS